MANILDQVAIDRYCLVDVELEPGLRSIAVPTPLEPEEPSEL